MQSYRIKKEFKKQTDDKLWTKIFEVGDIIEYNEWLLGWCLKLNVYRWQVVSKEEIDKQPDVFEEVK